VQEEDCLTLNIYAPRTPPPAGHTGYPTVVWIHGGSYETGGPQNASGIVELAGDIIFVGINYRMGWTGFLGGNALRSRDSGSGSTGNYGMQDQRLAMYGELLLKPKVCARGWSWIAPMPTAWLAARLHS
jgi:para-nitrobenzyl esterase